MLRTETLTDFCCVGSCGFPEAKRVLTAFRIQFSFAGFKFRALWHETLKKQSRLQLSYREPNYKT